MPHSGLYSQIASSSLSTSTSKLCSQTYKIAAQLFLTRRLEESLSALEPIITAPIVQHDEPLMNDDNTSPFAPIVTASSTLRIKVWNLYITLLSAIVDLGPEEGKRVLGQKRWKAIVAKVRDGEIWKTIIQTGYGGIEGSVDPDVVYNLSTLILNHSPSQTLNQQRLETYLSSYNQPRLDLATQLQDSFSSLPTRQIPSASGPDTPRDLAARVKIIELFTLHVLPRNDEWDYATEFIKLSEVLDEERKEAFLQGLERLKDESQRGDLRIADLQREKEEELERKMREQERIRADVPATPEQRNKNMRIGSEVDYGIEKDHPNGGFEKQLVKGVPNGTTVAASEKTALTPQQRPAKDVKQSGQSESVARQARILLNVFRSVLRSIAISVSGNPLAVLRTFLFILGFIMAFSRQDIRNRLRKIISTSWEKLRGTVGMGLKVSYM